MDGEYIIPANSKKSQLFFGLFNGVDLMVAGIGFAIEIPVLFISGSSLWLLLIKILPILITVFLLFPVAYYHNVRVFIKELYLYIKSQKRYYWRGWCATYGLDEQSKN